MKNALSLCLAAAAISSAAQVPEAQVSAATRRYRHYRVEFTEPPFGLSKVKALIARIKPAKGEDPDMETLATPAWSRLTTPEKFTYSMLHGEVSSQNCDAMPWVVDEQHKIFGQLSGLLGEQSLSDRQHKFLVGHRKEVVRLLRTTIREKRRVGLNLKGAIMELEAVDLIPDLVRAYERDRKDQDILTVLMFLMKEGKFKPFLASATYRKLYGDDASYQSFIVANAANQRLMIERAMAFYRSRVR